MVRAASAPSGFGKNALVSAHITADTSTVPLVRPSPRLSREAGPKVIRGEHVEQHAGVHGGDHGSSAGPRSSAMISSVVLAILQGAHGTGQLGVLGEQGLYCHAGFDPANGRRPPGECSRRPQRSGCRTR